MDFLSKVPTSSALATIFYHFDRRLKCVKNPETFLLKRELSLGQGLVRHLIFRRWGLYETDSAYGCPVTWMQRAIDVSIFVH